MSKLENKIIMRIEGVNVMDIFDQSNIWKFQNEMCKKMR